MLKCLRDMVVKSLLQRFAGRLGDGIEVDNHNLYITEFLDYGDVWCCGQ